MCGGTQTCAGTHTHTHTHTCARGLYIHTYSNNNLTFGKLFRIERKRKQLELGFDFYFVTEGLISSISLQTDSCTGGSYPSGRSTFAPGSSLPAFPSP